MSDMDRELDRLLRGMRDEALPEIALDSVRSGVRARITAGQRRRTAWTWLSVAAVAAGLWFAVVVIRAPRLARLAVIALPTPGIPEAEFQRGVAGLVRPRQIDSPSRASRSGRQRAVSGILRVDAKGNPDLRRSTAVASGRRTKESPPAADPNTGETQFIHIVTDDPDIVILWALNSKGDTR